MLNAIPTLFVVLNDMSVLKKYNTKNIDQMRSDSMAWSEEHLAADDIPDLVKAVIDMLLDVNKATPSVGQEEDGKKAEG